MRIRRLVAALLGLALLVGCGEDAGEPDAPDAAEERPGAPEDEDDGGGGGDEDVAPEVPGVDDDEDGAGLAADDDADEGPDGAWDEELDQLPTTRVAVEAGGETHELIARIAAEPADRRQGLMGIQHLPDDAGMLFAFPQDGDGGFWMKDTLIPLDIAYADADGEIVATAEMVPCDEDPCPTYDPGAEYRVALEVPGGWLEERDVGVGDQLSWDHLPEAS